MISFLVSILFVLHISFEAFNIIARVSSSLHKANAIGALLDKILSTLKRLFIFLYAPILGYMTMIDDIHNFFFSIVLSVFLSVIFLVIIIYKRLFFLSYFFNVSASINSGHGLVMSFFNGVSHSHEYPNIGSVKFFGDKGSLRLFLLLTIVYFIYSGSVFIVNVLALAYSDFAPVILQLIGFINGFATIVMAFIIEPVLAKVLEDRVDVGSAMMLFLFAQLLSLAVVFPLVFSVFYLVLFR